MKNLNIQKFVKKFKEKIKLEVIKAKFKKFTAHLKNLIFSDHKLEKLQQEIDDMRVDSKKHSESRISSQINGVNQEYFDNLTQNIENMLTEINKEQKNEWQSIQTTQVKKKLQLEHKKDAKLKDDYWTRRFKLVLNHQLSNRKNSSVIFFTKPPYSFKFPLLLRLYSKVKNKKELKLHIYDGSTEESSRKVR